MQATTEMIRHFSGYLKSQGKSPATIDCYCRDARNFLEYATAQGLDIQHIEAQSLLEYKSFLEPTDRENSVRRKIISIRQLFRCLKSSRLIPTSPFDEVPIPVRNDSLPLNLDEQAIEQLLAYHATNRFSSLKASRDAAILHLLGVEGLKANELIQLMWHHYRSSPVTPTLHVSGLRARTLEISKDTALTLDRYRSVFLQNEKEHANFRGSEQVFLAFRGRDGTHTIPQLTRHGLKFALHEIGERHSLSNLTTEILRHYAIQQFIAKGASLEFILRHLGLKRPGNVAKHFACLLHTGG